MKQSGQNGRRRHRHGSQSNHSGRHRHHHSSNGGGNSYSNNSNPQRTMTSQGPSGKITGNAQQLGEKYLQLAKDALSSGDPVTAEGFYQFAEHYQRLWREARANMPQQPVSQSVPDPALQAEMNGMVGDARAGMPADSSRHEGGASLTEDSRQSQDQDGDDTVPLTQVSFLAGQA